MLLLLQPPPPLLLLRSLRVKCTPQTTTKWRVFVVAITGRQERHDTTMTASLRPFKNFITNKKKQFQAELEQHASLNARLTAIVDDIERVCACA